MRSLVDDEEVVLVRESKVQARRTRGVVPGWEVEKVGFQGGSGGVWGAEACLYEGEEGGGGRVGGEGASSSDDPGGFWRVRVRWGG